MISRLARFLGLVAVCASVSWLTTDLRLQYAPRPTAGYSGSGPIQGMEFADYFTPFGGLPPADATGICATGTATSLCSPTTFPGTLSITGATGMIAFTGTAASSITNASTAGTQFGCSTIANPCYTFVSPASGASDTVDVQASTGSGYALQLAGSQALRVSSNTPTFQNNGSACTVCFNFDEKNGIAQSSYFLQVDSVGSNNAGFYCVVAAGCTASPNSIGLTLGATQVVGALGTNSLTLSGIGSIFTPSVSSTAISTSSKAATLVGMDGIIQVVAADVAGPITVNYPATKTYNTAPECFVQPQSQWTNAVFTKAVGGTSSCVVTFSGSVGTNDTFQIMIIGGH